MRGYVAPPARGYVAPPARGYVAPPRVYAPAPRGCEVRAFANAEEASQFLITEQSVCCVPWDDAGAFLRFSATYLARGEAEEDALMAETVERLGRLRLRF